MADTIEKIGKSIIQHGKLNNRVYIMTITSEDFDIVIKRTEELCQKENYTKVFAKVPRTLSEKLLKKGFVQEAEIPQFYRGKEDCIFLGNFLDKTRKNQKDKKIIEEIYNITKLKSVVDAPPLLEKNFHLRDLTEFDTNEMVEVFKSVFKSYPFPIFDKNYLIQTMKNNVEYAGIWYKKTLVSIASGEKSQAYKNAEMTDFATLPEFRGKNLALALLVFLEKKMIKQGYKTLYTIARAKSPGMNITFKKRNYNYSGTLINNTDISGSIESMNIWYKNISI